MASSEYRKRKLEEYEMQLFSFHSRAVYATLKNIVHGSIQRKIKTLCESLERKYKPTNESLKMLKTNQKQLENLYHKGAIPHLQSIENVVNKYIAIPTDVLLEEDKCQGTQYTDSEFANIKQNLEDLQQRAKRATILNAALKEELQALDQLTINEESSNKMCSIIKNGLMCPDVNDKMLQLVEDYKQFSTNITDYECITPKIMYNAIDDLKCKDCDFNSL